MKREKDREGERDIKREREREREKDREGEREIKREREKDREGERDKERVCSGTLCKTGINLLEVKLPYEPSCPSVGWLAGRSVCP